MKKLSFSIALISSFIICSCVRPTGDNKIYYNSNCLETIGPAFFAGLPLDSSLIRLWQEYKLKSRDTIGDIIEVNYLNAKPLFIKRFFINGYEKIQKTFEINDQKYSDIRILSKDTSNYQVVFYYFNVKVKCKIPITNHYVSNILFIPSKIQQ